MQTGCVPKHIPFYFAEGEIKNALNFRPRPIGKYLFLEQNSLYCCPKPRKATAFLRFVASTQEILTFYETAKHLKKKIFSDRSDENPR